MLCSTAETSTGTCSAFAARRSRGRWKRCWERLRFPSRRNFGWGCAGNNAGSRVKSDIRLPPCYQSPVCWLDLSHICWRSLFRYLLGDTWFWMPGESVNYSNWETKYVWQITSPCGGLDTMNSLFWVNRPCGDHLYFICLTGEDPVQSSGCKPALLEEKNSFLHSVWMLMWNKLMCEIWKMSKNITVGWNCFTLNHTLYCLSF